LNILTSNSPLALLQTIS